MEEVKNNGLKQSEVLKGMYMGMTGKLDEVNQRMLKELQYGSAQQVGAYEALSADFKLGIDRVLAELRYLAQQCTAIYDFSQAERNSVRDAVIEEVRSQTQGLLGTLTAHIDERINELERATAIDYDVLADKLAERLFADDEYVEEITAEEGEEPEEEVQEVEAVEEAEPVDAHDAFDYDVLAEKIASILPETDYDMIADKVVAALPQIDEQAIADKVVAALPQIDEHEIADHVADSVPLTDYDLIAEKVVAVLDEKTCDLGDEAVNKIAERVAEILHADEKDLERIVSEAVQQQTVAVEEPEPEEIAEVPAEAPAEELAVSEAPAPHPAPAPVVLPAVTEEQTVRYKRSFVAKIIESEEEVKSYYSDLKNAILAYSKVRSQINWTNDRFFIGNDSIIKIGVRGKTLCLYLALDPNEFPTTVYHQKYAGDTKMYELTPMMIKIKSKVAVKRGIRLIDLLMERNGAMKEERENVDYAAQYFFRTEEELLAEGLIKTAVVEKSDLDF